MILYSEDKRRTNTQFNGALKISFYLALVFIVSSLIFLGCDDLKEKKGDDPALEQGNGTWDFPYYLVIGGGFSETLSLLTIYGEDSFKVENDVQLLCSAVNQLVYFETKLYALCSLSNSLVAYDSTDLTITKEISLGAGNNPMNILFQNDDKGYVTNFLSNTVTYYDLSKSEGKLLATIDMPSGTNLPSDIGDQTWARPAAIVGIEEKIFVALSNLNDKFIAGGAGMVAVIDAGSDKISKLITLEGKNTVGLLVDSDNKTLYAISAGESDPTTGGFIGNGMVEYIDGATGNIIDSITLDGAPFEMVINQNNIAYLSNGKEGIILSFDMNTKEILSPIDIRDPDDDIALSFASALTIDGNGLLYAVEFNHDKLYVIDTFDDNKIIYSQTVNDGPDALALIN